MAGQIQGWSGRIAGVAVLLASLAFTPALAEDVPLPMPRPANTQPTTTGSIAKPAAPAQPQQAQAAPAQMPNPVSNPFAALLGKPGSTTALNADQRAIVEKVNNYLSNMHVLSGKFVQVAPDGRRTQGEFYISKPGKVRFEYDDPEPDRTDRRRPVGGGARPQSGDARRLSAVADAAALPACRPCRPDEGHQPGRGLRRRRVRHRDGRGEERRWSAPAG